MTNTKLTNTKKVTRPRKHAAIAKASASARAAASAKRETIERMNERLRALLTKRYPTTPAPVFPATDAATEMAMLSYIAASISFVRRDFTWNMEKAMEDTATRQRVERNVRLLRRLVYVGLVRRGEVPRIK